MQEFDEKIVSLIDKYIRGVAEPHEISELNAWYHSFKDDEVEIHDISATELNDLKASMLSEIIGRNKDVRYSARPIAGLSINMKVAAVVTIALLSTALLYMLGDFRFKSSAETHSAPGLLVESAEPGQKRTISLSDGSRVELNAGSTIRYIDGFSDSVRRMELTGEAFFEVVRDVSRPFIIKAGVSEVSVLGTSFNITSYEDLATQTVAVKTGKVAVVNMETGESLQIVAGEMSTLDRDGSLSRKSIDDDYDVIFGWMQGQLVFKDNNINQIINILSKWYGVQFQVKKDISRSVLFTGSYNNPDLKDVLKSLSLVYKFKYSINEKLVIIE